MSEPQKNKRKAEKTSPEPDNSLKPKERWEIWLGLSNLVLTVIIGVGVAIFLNYRNEKIQLEIIELQANFDRQLNSQQTDAQKQLIELQIENERKSKIANIEVAEICYYFFGCDGVLSVKNTGPADASNIRIILYSPHITDSWLPYIKDISGFSVRIPSPLINFTVTQTTVDSLSNSNLSSNPNAFEVTIKDLKAGESFLILTKPSPDLSLQQFDVTRHITIHKAGTEYLFYMDSLKKFINQLYLVAVFNIDLNCGNCLVENSPSWYSVSSVENLGSAEYTNQSDSVDELSIPFTYFMPKELNHMPDSANLDLNVTAESGAAVFQKTSP